MVKLLKNVPSRTRLAWGIGTAIAIRIVLALLGVLNTLIWRPEVTTPANSLLQIREGVQLLQLSVPPYSGSGCHIPPLVLSLWAPWVSSIWYIVPTTICDLLGAAVVSQIAAAAHRRHDDTGMTKVPKHSMSFWPLNRVPTARHGTYYLLECNHICMAWAYIVHQPKHSTNYT